MSEGSPVRPLRRRARGAVQMARRRANRIGGPVIWLLAMVLGVLVGLASVGFRKAIDLVQQATYGVDDSTISLLAVAPWWLFFLVPAGAGLVVGLLIQFGLPGGRSHGIADVIRARDLNRGRVDIREGLVTAAVAVVSLGGGASTGREGPVVHIGATLSSAGASLLRLGAGHGRTLLGCAAAAGVSALFNAPIAGTLFALEVVLGAYSIRVFAPIVVASVSGTLVNRLLVGDEPAFTVPQQEMTTLWQLPLFVVLGALSALVAVLLARMIFVADAFGDRVQDRFRLPMLLRPVIAGLLLGGLGYAIPQVIGVGYAATTSALYGSFAAWTALLILAVKMVAVAISFAGRFGGGLFSPSLMIGALLGAAFGDILAFQLHWVELPEIGLYALAGMGAVSAVVLGAPISTSLIVFELTGDYRTALAVMVSVSVAAVLAQRRLRRSFFYEQLERQGVPLAGGRHDYELHTTPVHRILDEPQTGEEAVRCRELLAEGISVAAGDSLARVLALTVEHDLEFLPVAAADGSLCGVAHRSDALALHSRSLLAEYQEQHD